MNINYEVYNYLNLINPELGKIYKLTGQTFLPEDFSLTEQLVRERLIVAQGKISYPNFLTQDKKTIKKHFKVLLKNLKSLQKNDDWQKGYSAKFCVTLNTSIKMMIATTKLSLKNFKNFDFDEHQAFNQIAFVNPLLFELLQNIYDNTFDISKLSNLEKVYENNYLKLVKLQEERNEKLEKTTEKTVKLPEKMQKIQKNAQKTVEKAKKPVQKKVKKVQQKVQSKQTTSIKEKK